MRWALQAAARNLLPDERVGWCLRKPVPKMNVEVWWCEHITRAHYKNLRICGSVWQCPICAAKITERRRLELSAAVDQATGLRLALVTFTMHHDRRDKLDPLLKDLVYSYSHHFRQGEPWQRMIDQFGIVGNIRALEVTHWLNGWHPHLHVLFFLNGRVDHEEMQSVFAQRWVNCLEAAGRRADLVHGVDVRTAKKDVAHYIAKFGKEPKNAERPFKWTMEHEITKSPSKRGMTGPGMTEHRTPTQLLIDYVAGDKAPGRLWTEYAQAFKGQKQLVWSNGLKKLLGVAVKTDEQIAHETEEPSVLLFQLSYAQWRVILGNDARGEFIEAAHAGDAQKLIDFLNELEPARPANRPVGRNLETVDQIAGLKKTAAISREMRRNKKEWLEQNLEVGHVPD